VEKFATFKCVFISNLPSRFELDLFPERNQRSSRRNHPKAKIVESDSHNAIPFVTISPIKGGPLNLTDVCVMVPVDSSFSIRITADVSVLSLNLNHLSEIVKKTAGK
jgi:hypothetical protein